MLLTFHRVTLHNGIFFVVHQSSSTCHAACADLPESLPPPFSIVHRSQWVFKDTSCIGIEQLYVSFSWSSALCSSMWRGLQEYITYEFVYISTGFKIHYIYIYIYIVIHRQTLSFYQNSSVWWDTLDAWSRVRVPSNFTLHLVSDHSANKRTTLAKGILRYCVATESVASVCLHFYTLSATRVLNSFEELCIMRAAAENSFARVLNPHGGAYILSTDRLFRSVRTLQCG